MRQLILELSDQEMAALEALAKAERLAPASLAKDALLKVLAERAGETSQSRDSVGAQQPDVAHAKRLAAAMTMHGIWRERERSAKARLKYQREVRAE